MRRELSWAMALIVTFGGAVTAQDSDLQAMRAKLQQIQEQLRRLENCANETSNVQSNVQTLDVNATTRRRIVWMRESQAQAMGLELWKDENGVTPRVSVAADTPVSGASVLSNSIPAVSSNATVFSAPSTFAAPVQTFAAPVQTFAAPVQTFAAPVQTFAAGGVATSASSASLYVASNGLVVQSTAASGADNNAFLQEAVPYYRQSWVARSPEQAYETVTFHGRKASTTPNEDNPYVIYPWQARWSFR